MEHYESNSSSNDDYSPKGSEDTGDTNEIYEERLPSASTPLNGSISHTKPAATTALSASCSVPGFHSAFQPFRKNVLPVSDNMHSSEGSQTDDGCDKRLVNNGNSPEESSDTSSRDDINPDLSQEAIGGCHSNKAVDLVSPKVKSEPHVSVKDTLQVSPSAILVSSSERSNGSGFMAGNNSEMQSKSALNKDSESLISNELASSRECTFELIDSDMKTENIVSPNKSGVNESDNTGKINANCQNLVNIANDSLTETEVSKLVDSNCIDVSTNTEYIDRCLVDCSTNTEIIERLAVDSCTNTDHTENCTDSSTNTTRVAMIEVSTNTISQVTWSFFLFFLVSFLYLFRSGNDSNLFHFNLSDSHFCDPFVPFPIFVTPI